MPGIINAIATRHFISLNAQQTKSSSIFDEITTGHKADISVADKIIGYKTFYAANAAREIVKQIGTGVNVTNVAISTLSEIQNQIEDLKLSIIALNNAKDVALVAGQESYTNQLNRINKILDNVTFGTKKLFDGTSSINSSPFNVQVGTNSNDILKITIDKLTNGLGLVPDVITPGANNNLFPITAKAIANKDFAVQEIIQINDIIQPGGLAAAQTYINSLTPTTPGAAIKITIFNAAKTAIIAAAAGTIPDPLGTNKLYNAVINAALGVAKQRGYISQESVAAIRSVIVEGDSSVISNNVTDAQYYSKIAAMSVPDAIINPIGYNIISAAKSSLNPSTSIPGSFITQKNLILKNIITTALINTTSYGNILTNADRVNATTLLTNARDKLTVLITDISSLQTSLFKLRSMNSTLNIQLSDASAVYLNTDYEAAISSLNESQRKIKAASFANFLAEKLIDSIIKKLSQAVSAA